MYLLSEAVPYREVDPTTLKTPLYIGIRRNNGSDKKNALGTMMVVFGREGVTSEMPTDTYIRASEMPKGFEVMGARFTALSEADGKMRVSVQSSMPTQPFTVQMQAKYTMTPIRY